MVVHAFVAVSAALLLLVLFVPVVTSSARCSDPCWRPTSRDDGMRMELTATTIEVRERGADAVGGVQTLVAPRVRGRDEFEALGLLLGVLFVLLVLAVAVGATPPIWG